MEYRQLPHGNEQEKFGVLGLGLALEALQVVAELVALGMAEGQHNDELHALHLACGFGVHPAHTQPAHAQAQCL